RASHPDRMLREIEAALDNRRNIVPLMLEGFDFGTPAIAIQLTGKLAELKKYNGIEIPKGYFSQAMRRLRDKFLNVLVDVVLHPPSLLGQQAATEQKDKATMALGDEHRKGEDEQPRNAAQAEAASKVFISYRRDVSKYQARMIYAAFCKAIPSDHVFMDVD